MADTGRTTIGIAIDIPAPWRDQLTARRAAAGDPAAEHVPAHLTVLGPTPVDTRDLPPIERHLATVAERHGAFPLLLRGTGTFRPVTQVVFVSVAVGAVDCEELHHAVVASPEIRRGRCFPYHPHVTVAHDVPAGQLDAVLADLAGFEARFDVAGFTLFEQVGGEGPVARWETRREYPLVEVGASGAASGSGRRR
jgi:2'-5' RNA ligase